MNRTLSVLFLFCLSVTIKKNSIRALPCQPKYRLSSDVRPTSYSIKIYPNLDDGNFTGEVLINIQIKDLVEHIEFHVNRNFLSVESIILDSKKVCDLASNIISCCSCEESVDGYQFHYGDLVRIIRRGGRMFSPGSHRLRIKYLGRFSNGPPGFFEGTYTKNGTIISRLWATDFEPTYARGAFPCFDEPSFKARFQLTVAVPNNSYIALSNMRAGQIYGTSKGIVYRFEKTPLMPTYILAFAVIPRIDHVKFVDDSGLPFSIYSTESDPQNSTKLLEFSSQVLSFYTNFTHFKYTLPKIDFLSFDRNKTAATENWGLITVRTGLLSPFDGVFDLEQKHSVLAHELAHFWFGNLVTNQWWDDIWLHESFATFMGIKAENLILNNSADQLFPLQTSENIFFLEYSNETNPVVNFAEKPTDVQGNFNEVTYGKGAAILRMLEATVGEESIRNIFIEYIRKFAFGVASTDDFLTVVENVTSDANIREFMETFLYQSRFPVIFIEENGENYVLRQSRSHFNHKIHERTTFSWTIPITYITNVNNTYNIVWLNQDMDALYLPKNDTKWIKLNYQHIGYYKVHYSKGLWNNLIKYNQELPDYEKYVLLLNAVSLVEMNLDSCDSVLSFIWQTDTKISKSYLEYLYTTYLRLEEVIEQYNLEASQKLKKFFGHFFYKVERHRVGKRLINESSESFQDPTVKTPKERIAQCIEWILQESYTYYS